MKTTTTLTPNTVAEKPHKAPSVLDNAIIKYAARCSYCERKQKVLATYAYPTNWDRKAINVCANCALGIAGALVMAKLRR